MSVELHEAWGFKAKLSEWAEMFHLEKATLYKRLQRGHDLETALSNGLYQSETHPRYTAPDGETHTAREWGEIIGITAGAFRERINDGLPPEKVFAKRDLRIKDDEKKPTQPPDAEKGMIRVIYCDALGVKPSVTTIKASDFDFFKKSHQYVGRIR